MANNQLVVLDVQMDVHESGVTKITKDLMNIRRATMEVANAITAAFEPIIENFESFKISVDNLVGATERATEVLDLLIEQLADGQLEDRAWNITDTVINGLALLATLATSDNGVKMLVGVANVI